MVCDLMKPNLVKRKLAGGGAALGTMVFEFSATGMGRIMAEAGAKPEHMVRMTWYVVDKAEYLASIKGVGEAWREIMGRTFPCIAAIEVKGLMEAEAKIEIETTAVLPR